MPQRNTAAYLSTSRHARSAAAACAALGLVLVAACSTEQPGGPLAPQASTVAAGKGPALLDTKVAKDARNRLSDGLLNVVTSTWKTDSTQLEAGVDLPQALTCGVRGQFSASLKVDGRGGVLRMGASSLTVPAGALTQAVTITATVTVDDQGPRVDFAPHGLRFLKPVEVVADYSGCTVPEGAALNVYYLNDGGGIVQVMPSADRPQQRQIHTITDHFSGYLVSSGRR